MVKINQIVNEIQQKHLICYLDNRNILNKNTYINNLD